MSRRLAFSFLVFFAVIWISGTFFSTALAFLLSSAVFLALVFWLSRSVSIPAARMARAALRWEAGDYSARVPDAEGDELGALGQALNRTAQKIQGIIAALSREKEQLAAILNHMDEAVAAVDSGGKILEVNPSFVRLFSADSGQAKGKPFLEILRHGELSDMLRLVLQEGRPLLREVRVLSPEERVFETHAVPWKGPLDEGGALLVMHDITRLRRLENIRRDFVANVSHEFKTPVAAIKGFAETLKSGALEDKKHRLEFVETIERHADRLARLVDDLLDLSAIESGQRPLEREEFALAQLAREVALSLEPLAQKRGIQVEVEPSEVRINADRNQMRQVLTNLMDNAIKFNREGGKVWVGIGAEASAVTVSVRDEGPGISKEDLSRVFERFYRAHKDRSQDSGGTGLGLAIVKHIVEAHGGMVTAESREEEGSVFSFTLPAVI